MKRSSIINFYSKTELNGHLKELVHSNMNLVIAAVETIAAEILLDLRSYRLPVCMRTATFIMPSWKLSM